MLARGFFARTSYLFSPTGYTCQWEPLAFFASFGLEIAPCRFFVFFVLNDLLFAYSSIAGTVRPFSRFIQMTFGEVTRADRACRLRAVNATTISLPSSILTAGSVGRPALGEPGERVFSLLIKVASYCLRRWQFPIIRCIESLGLFLHAGRLIWGSELRVRW